MNVTLRQLSAFVAMAETGSFTLAAERLFITQSALIGLIKELERSFWLFTRRGRALSPAAQEFRSFLQQRLRAALLC